MAEMQEQIIGLAYTTLIAFCSRSRASAYVYHWLTGSVDDCLISFNLVSGTLDQ